MASKYAGSNKRPTTTRTQSRDTGRKPGVEWIGFVQYEPTESDRRAMASYVASGKDPLDLVEAVIGDGTYDLKVRKDLRNGCYAATLYCGTAGHRHAGYALAARASSPWEAQRRVLFLHTIVLEGEWNVTNEGSDWNDDRW